ncbi:MAG: hypothetical protein AB8H79_09685 [Myxococcota bacterium]
MTRWLPLLLVACFGGRASDPPPNAALPAAQSTPPEAPPPTTAVPQPDVDADAAAAVDVNDEIARRLPGPLAVDIAAVKRAFDSASSAADVAAAYRRSLGLAERLEESLMPAFQATDYEPLDLGWLKPSLPAMNETYMAEGMALVFDLDADGWAAKAASTPEPEDDAFFAMMKAGYGSARPMGWAAWDQRTWDYGGCSGLGSGVVLDVLTKVDAANAAGDLFKAEIAEMRRLALLSVLEDHPEFPRCSVDTLEPMDDAKIAAEVQGILDTVTLTDDETSKVNARKPMLRGQAHKGG